MSTEHREQVMNEHFASISGPTAWTAEDEAALAEDQRESERIEDWRQTPQQREDEVAAEIDLASERESREAAERQAAELQAQNQQAAEQQYLLQAEMHRRANPPPPPVQIPDANQDPVGHIVGRLEQQQRATQALTQWALQAEHGARVAQQQQAVAGAVNHVLNSEREFASRTPDYEDSSKFLIEHRDRELRTAGITDAAQRQAQLREEALQISVRAIQMNKNPAEIVYQLAKDRGFGGSGSRGGLPAGMTAQRLARMSDREFARYDKGLGPNAPPSAEKLLAMSDDAFMKALDTPEGRALLGR